MAHIGVDLHTDKFNAVKIHEDGSKKTGNFSITDGKISSSFYNFVSKDDYLMVEATSNSFKFIELIKDHVKEAFVANTYKLKLISLVKKKTDIIDAEKLALYLKMQVTSGEKLIEPVYIPENTIQNLRSLFTTYKLYIKMKVMIKNRIHALLKQNFNLLKKANYFLKIKFMRL